MNPIRTVRIWYCQEPLASDTITEKIASSNAGGHNKQNQNNMFLALFTSCFFVVSVAATAANAGYPARRLIIDNESGGKVSVDWVNPVTGDSVPIAAPTASGEKIAFESFVNHSFLVHFLGEESNNTAAATVTVRVTEEEGEQVVMLKEGSKVERVEQSSPSIASRRDIERDSQGWEYGTVSRGKTSEETQKAAHSVVVGCRRSAGAQLAVGRDVETIMNSLDACMEERAASIFENMNSDLVFQNKLLKSLSAQAENYTCADPNKVTSTPTEIRTWEHNGVMREIGVFHNRPASQIHILKNFISPEECEAIEKAAAPTLHRGTVADGKGGSKMSDNRKAWQAGVQYGKDPDDPIRAVKQRLFDYANHVTGYGMSLPGQEDIMSIQYFGNGEDDPTPDQYTPHCDGECSGLPHKTGGRVATMVMYCDVPELGGGTNFQNANVFVKPEKGAAAFFSYMDNNTGKHEDGMTSHSGCPVLKGTKRIAVQWMRVGVDARNPWNSFDTNTISKSFYEE